MNTTCEVIGESCFLLNINGIRILTDPWFGEPIYGGSWTQFPFPIVSPQNLTNISYIFISHVHPDHCCIQSLQTIFNYSPSARVIIMDRGSSNCYLSKKLSRSFDDTLDLTIVKLKPYQRYILDGVSMWCIPPSIEHSLNEMIDSSLVVESPEGLIFFANDNLPTVEHAEFLNSLRSHQYIALLPFSGGSGYPSSYHNLSEAEKLDAACKVRSDYESYAISFLSFTNFDFYMPVAGNHILASRSYDFHQGTGFLLNPYTVIKKTNSRVPTALGVYANPGSQILPPQDPPSQTQLSASEKTFEFQKKLFIEAVSSRIRPWIYECAQLPNTEVFDCLSRFSAPLADALSRVSSEHSLSSPILAITCGNLYLVVDENSVSIDSVSDPLLAFDYVLECYSDNPSLLCIDIMPQLLRAITEKRIHINEADAACLLTYHRSMPYIPELYAAIFTIVN